MLLWHLFHSLTDLTVGVCLQIYLAWNVAIECPVVTLLAKPTASEALEAIHCKPDSSVYIPKNLAYNVLPSVLRHGLLVVMVRAMGLRVEHFSYATRTRWCLPVPKPCQKLLPDPTRGYTCSLPVVAYPPLPGPDHYIAFVLMNAARVFSTREFSVVENMCCMHHHNMYVVNQGIRYKFKLMTSLLWWLKNK